MLTVAAVVVFVHVGALALWQIKTGDEPLRQRPDLTIEFFTPAPVPGTEAAAPADPPVAPKAVRQPISSAPAKVATGTIAQATAEISEPAQTETPPSSEQNVAEAAPQGVKSESLAMASTEADYKAAYLNNPKPPYPLSAVRQGAEGRVVLWAEVLPDGRAGRVSLEKSSGHALLDASAMNTVRAWRFTPARKDGVVTTQAVRIPIDFTLQDRR